MLCIALHTHARGLGAVKTAGGPVGQTEGEGGHLQRGEGGE